MTLLPTTIQGFTNASAIVNGVKINYWLGGDPAGPPVLLWHGFVETSYAWRNVAPILASAGRAILIPDMRGYGDSEKPGGTDGYDARSLAEDFRALVTATHFGGGRKLVIAAHDMGAPPALIWTSDHPQEVATLVYIDEPVMLGDVIRNLVAYTPEKATAFGGLFWWLLPYAQGAAEKIIVGNERGWLEWFYNFGQSTIAPEVIDEYLRTFRGAEGVLGALGVYRAGFRSISQTEPLLDSKVTVPVIAVGGALGLGKYVGEMVSLVGSNVKSIVIDDCGHFALEDQPERLAEIILAAA